jgi:hypothetical protein
MGIPPWVTFVARAARCGWPLVWLGGTRKNNPFGGGR